MEKQLNRALKEPDSAVHFTNGLHHILQTASAILATSGDPGWASFATDDAGRPLFRKDEQEAVENNLEPLVQSLVAFRDNRVAAGQTSQKGGAGQTNTQGLDELYDAAMSYMNSMNEKMNQFSSKYGTLRLEHDYDETGEDFHPFSALELIPPGSLGGVEEVGYALARIPIPIRAVVFFARTVMDIVRILTSLPGADHAGARKTLSIVIAIIDLLGGQWKKALFSLAGVWGQYQMYVGVVGKIALDTFYLLNPELREQIVFGALSVSKSLVFGLLLRMFQLFSPAPLRDTITGVFTELARGELKIDRQLARVNLPPREAYLTPTFDYIQNIQAVISDPARVCSEEFQVAIGIAKQSLFLKVGLQLMGIPTSQEELKRVCGAGGVPDESYVERVVQDALQRLRHEHRPVHEQTSDIVAEIPKSTMAHPREEHGGQTHSLDERRPQLSVGGAFQGTPVLVPLPNLRPLKSAPPRTSAPPKTPA